MYCGRNRADIILSTDGQMDKVKPVYIPSTSLSRGLNICAVSSLITFPYPQNADLCLYVVAILSREHQIIGVTILCKIANTGECFPSTVHTHLQRALPTPKARFMGQHGAHLGPTGPRWVPCWPHEPCCLGTSVLPKEKIVFILKGLLLHYLASAEQNCPPKNYIFFHAHLTIHVAPYHPCGFFCLYFY